MTGMWEKSQTLAFEFNSEKEILFVRQSSLERHWREKSFTASTNLTTNPFPRTDTMPP